MKLGMIKTDDPRKIYRYYNRHLTFLLFCVWFYCCKNLQLWLTTQFQFLWISLPTYQGLHCDPALVLFPYTTQLQEGIDLCSPDIRWSFVASRLRFIHFKFIVGPFCQIIHHSAILYTIVPSYIPSAISYIYIYK